MQGKKQDVECRDKYRQTKGDETERRIQQSERVDCSNVMG